jgi:hypothetical protein
MQHARIRISAQFCHDEGRLMGHQTADEMDVATEPVQLGHDDRRLVLLRFLERRRQLWPTIERIGALAGLNLFEGLDQVVAFGLREACQSRLLGLQTKTRFALPCRRYADVGDSGFHRAATS